MDDKWTTSPIIKLNKLFCRLIKVKSLLKIFRHFWFVQPNQDMILIIFDYHVLRAFRGTSSGGEYVKGPLLNFRFKI